MRSNEKPSGPFCPWATKPIRSRSPLGGDQRRSALGRPSPAICAFTSGATASPEEKLAELAERSAQVLPHRWPEKSGSVSLGSRSRNACERASVVPAARVGDRLQDQRARRGGDQVAVDHAGVGELDAALGGEPEVDAAVGLLLREPHARLVAAPPPRVDRPRPRAGRTNSRRDGSVELDDQLPRRRRQPAARRWRTPRRRRAPRRSRRAARSRASARAPGSSAAASAPSSARMRRPDVVEHRRRPLDQRRGRELRAGRHELERPDGGGCREPRRDALRAGPRSRAWRGSRVIPSSLSLSTTNCCAEARPSRSNICRSPLSAASPESERSTVGARGRRRCRAASRRRRDKPRRGGRGTASRRIRSCRSRARSRSASGRRRTARRRAGRRPRSRSRPSSLPASAGEATRRTISWCPDATASAFTRAISASSVAAKPRSTISAMTTGVPG